MGTTISAVVEYRPRSRGSWYAFGTFEFNKAYELMMALDELTPHEPSGVATLFCPPECSPKTGHAAGCPRTPEKTEVREEAHKLALEKYAEAKELGHVSEGWPKMVSASARFLRSDEGWDESLQYVKGSAGINAVRKKIDDLEKDPAGDESANHVCELLVALRAMLQSLEHQGSQVRVLFARF